MTKISDPLALESDGLLLGARLVTLDGAEGYIPIEDGALGWKDGRLDFVGRAADLPPAMRKAREPMDAAGTVVTPGLIDCHTHAVFAGDRAGEFEQRLQGASYEEIARSGGGIVSSVLATRAASEDELFAQSLPRARALRDDGVTTLEIKSGYGLDFDNERKMLRVARRIGGELGITVRTTFLGAHALPPEFAGRADEYIDAVCEWLPRLHDEGPGGCGGRFLRAHRIHAAQTRRVFEVAAYAWAAGQAARRPVERWRRRGAGRGIRRPVGGPRRTHFRSRRGARWPRPARSRCCCRARSTACAKPCCRRSTPFRRHGVPMAVATDCNPGTSPLQSLRLAMSLACTHFRLTPEEALRGATVNAARALGLRDRGVLRVGMRADFACWHIRQPAELAYWLGGDPLTAIYANGNKPLSAKGTSFGA